MSGLTRFPTESAIIGRLLAGYADLELDLLHCVHSATGDFESAMRAIFEKRGETGRIDRAVKLGRPPYVVLEMESDFDAAVAAIRHCLQIRNQYAHHNFWDDNSGQLAIGDLEKVAKLPGPFSDLSSVQVEHVDVPLLQAQEAYFRYTDALLAWVNFEGRSRNQKLTQNPVSKPPPPASPKLHL